MSQLEILGQVALAGALGGVLGAEREWHGKPAGLRTQMLVAGAAALFVALGPVLIEQIEARTFANVTTDPVRIVEAIITGISFIGAGSIMFHRGENTIEGVTTAATVLLSAAIGVTVALHQYILAGALTGTVLVVLLAMGKIDAIIRGKRGVAEEKPAKGDDD